MEAYKLYLYQYIYRDMTNDHYSAVRYDTFTEEDYIRMFHEYAKANNKRNGSFHFNENDELHSEYNEDLEQYVPSIIYYARGRYIENYIYFFNGKIIDINHPVRMKVTTYDDDSDKYCLYYDIYYYSSDKLINNKPISFSISFMDDSAIYKYHKIFSYYINKYINIYTDTYREGLNILCDLQSEKINQSVYSNNIDYIDKILEEECLSIFDESKLYNLSYYSNNNNILKTEKQHEYGTYSHKLKFID